MYFWVKFVRLTKENGIKWKADVSYTTKGAYRNARVVLQEFLQKRKTQSKESLPCVFHRGLIYIDFQPFDALGEGGIVI